MCVTIWIQQMLSELSSRKWTYLPPSIKVINGLKIKREKIRSKFTTPKRHIYTPWGICVCNMKTNKQMLSEISSGKWTYHLPSIKVNNGLKIEGQQLGQSSYPPKAHLHPLRDVCVQYENNPANASWDIIRKLNLSSAINWSQQSPENQRSKIRSKVITPKRHIYTPWGIALCVQYENNSANALRDIVRKQNLSSAINWSQ